MMGCTMAVLAAESELEDAEAACREPCPCQECRDCPDAVETRRGTGCGQARRREAARQALREVRRGNLPSLPDEVLDTPIAELERHGVSPGVLEKLVEVAGGLYIRDLLLVPVERLRAVPYLGERRVASIVEGVRCVVKGEKP